ncbi:DUF6498-containing protein [Halorubrum sp. DTA46]|uniref:DUF6498-containing protein n=1 Tax=Halorubrum sp. DTA46 TaxID=3402162 RepID=UPI003AAC2434
MPSTSGPGRHRPHFGFGPILLANLIPLFGVLRLGWDPATLVVIYALELLFTFPLAGMKALFAARPPRTDREESSVVSVSSELTETRGSLRLVPWLPPVYPRNLPFATAVVNGAVWFLIAFGVVLSSVVAAGDVLTRPEVLVGALALILGQSVETLRDFFRGGYETASAYSVIETPTRQAFFLTFALMMIPGIGGVGAEGVLGVIVLVKLLIEWSAYRATTDGTGRLTDWLSGPEPMDADLDPVEIPDDTPGACISTDRRAVLYTAVFDVVGRLAPFLVMPFIFVWFVVISVLGDGASPGVTIGASVVIVASFLGSLAMRVLFVFLQYGSLEYHRDGDRIVAYDTLLAEPQWSASIPALRNVQIVPDRLADRLLGTRTLAITTGWGDIETRRYLGPTTDGDDLIEAFELPVRTADLDPIDRRPAAFVTACLVALGGALVVLAIGPWLTLGELLFGGLTYGVFGIPIIGLTLRLLWVQTYPERTTDPVQN